jgi:hypothetical protein
MCAFCKMGICINPAHVNGSRWEASFPRSRPVGDDVPPLEDDEEVPIFDITGRTTRRLLSSIRPPSIREIRRREDAQTEAWFEARRIRCPSQAREAEIISEALRVVIGKPNIHAIPKIIHRFWSGGAMRKGAFHNLYTAGEAARRAGWKCYLWYSTTIEDMLDAGLAEEQQRLRQSQRQALELAGYEIGFVEGLAPPRRRGALQFVDEETVIAYARIAARGVINNRDYDGVKYFSDFARLLYLHGLGGFHIDVDMGLGDMDLSCTYCHNDPAGEVPLLGTLARDSTNVDVVRRLKALKAWLKLGTAPKEDYYEAVRFLANAAMQGAGMYNGLIATRPNTSHGRLAIIEYQEKAKSLNRVELLRGRQVASEGLPTGMAVQPTLLCGAAGRGALELAMCQSVPPYVIRLDQVTDESDIGAGVKKR